MPGTKCPTVRSGGTTSVRSALMPILMMSRASMEWSENDRCVVPANAWTHNHRRFSDAQGGQQAPCSNLEITRYGSRHSPGRQENYLLCIALRSTKVLPPFIL